MGIVSYRFYLFGSDTLTHLRFPADVRAFRDKYFQYILTWSNPRMKLSEIKTALVDKFFSKQAAGVSRIEIEPVFIDLGKFLKADLTELATNDATVVVELEQGSSSDPSKAFKRFTEGRTALLSICEDDGFKKMVIFAAVRIGSNVVYEDLTVDERVLKKGDLASIKSALRQAKNLNEDAYFNIKSEG